jgi:23S rRNA (uracil1939-C5)-methyltransferase
VGPPLPRARVFAGEVRLPAIIGDPTPFVVGADAAPLKLAPGGFAQASEEANAALARHVDDATRALASDPAATVVELFAGAGNLTVLLARERSGVIAVESDRDACAAARANLAVRGLTARIVEADARGFAIPASTKIAILDPPRVGAKEVCRALAERPVPGVVYVSCDPPTLGRDLEMLASAGYELRTLDTFEMFPQTSHVESVAVLERPRGARKR